MALTSAPFNRGKRIDRARALQQQLAGPLQQIVQNAPPAFAMGVQGGDVAPAAPPTTVPAPVAPAPTAPAPTAAPMPAAQPSPIAPTAAPTSPMLNAPDPARAALDQMFGRKTGGGNSALDMLGRGVASLAGGGGAMIFNKLKGGKSADEKQSELAAYLDTRTTELNKQLGGLSGLDDQARNTLTNQLQLIGITAEDKNEAKTMFKDMMTTVLPTLLSDAEARKQRQSMMVSTQAWLGPLISKQMDRSNMLAGQWGQQASAAAKYVRDPELRALAQSQAAQLQSQVAQGNLGYMQQIAATPALYGYGSPAAPTGGAPTGATNINDLLGV